MTTRIPPSVRATVESWRIGRRIVSGHQGAVLSLAFAEVNSRPFVVTGGEDGSIRRWDGLDGSLMGAPILVGSTPVHAVILFELQDVPVIGAASGDGSIRIFDAIDGAVVAGPMWGHDGAVRTIAATSIDGAPMIVSGGIDGSIRRFDLGSMKEIGEPLLEQTGAVLSVSVGAVGDRLLVASGGSDGLVRRFDARTGALVGEPMEGHTRAVRTSVIIDLADQPTIVTGSSDGSVCRFDAREGTLIDEPVVLHSGGIRSVAIGRLGETQVIVAAGSDGTLSCLDASSGQILGKRLAGHMGQVGAVAALPGSSVLVSGGDDGSLVLWRPTDALLDERRLAVTPRLVSDIASDTDLLELQPTANALIDFLAHPQTAAPLSVAVKGPWGAGKSTLMRLVRDGLDPVGVDGTRSRIRLATSSRLEPGAHSTHSVRRFLRRTSSKRGLTTGNVFVEAGRPDGQVPAGRDDGHRVTVWFNPWSYQTGEQVWAGFAHELAEQVSGRLPRRQRELFWLRLNLARVDRSAVRRSFYQSVFERAIKPAAALAIVASILLASGLVEGAIAVLTGGIAVAVAATAGLQWGRPASSLYQTLVDGPVYDRVRAARDALPGLEKYAPDPDYGARSGYVHLIQTDVQRVVKLAATPERPLVIFVDDLDRCAPRTVLQVLEAINLFLAGELNGCIFVLGIEPTMLAAHIETDYVKLIGSLRRRDPRLRGEDMSWKFLEKLIQLSVRVPDPSNRGLSDLLDRLLGHEDADRPTEVPSDLETVHRERSTEPAVARGGAAGVPAGSGPTGGVEPGTSIGPAVAARARRAIATTRVQELLTFEDPRVRAMVAERVRAITRNPRGVKRVVNLFVFHSYLAAARGLLPLSDDALLADLAKILDLAELLIRWPEFTERLAARDAGGTIALVDLAAAAACSDEAAWSQALRQFGLVARVAGATDDQTSEAALEEPAQLAHDVPTDALRSFLRQVSGSVTLMSELI